MALTPYRHVTKEPTKGEEWGGGCPLPVKNLKRLPLVRSSHSSALLQMEEVELCFPELLNSSCRRTKPSQFAAVLVPLTLSFICLTTMTLNLLVIISVSHFR